MNTKSAHMTTKEASYEAARVEALGFPWAASEWDRLLYVALALDVATDANGAALESLIRRELAGKQYRPPLAAWPALAEVIAGVV